MSDKARSDNAQRQDDTAEQLERDTSPHGDDDTDSERADADDGVDPDTDDGSRATDDGEDAHGTADPGDGDDTAGAEEAGTGDATAAVAGAPEDDAPAVTRERKGVSMAAPQPQQKPRESVTAVTATKSARKAHLTVARVEPWSVMKFSFVISLVCFIILFVAVAVLYAILSSLGVFDAVSGVLSSLAESGEGEGGGLNPENWFSPARVLGYTGLIGALNIILITALSTVAAMLYNLAADLVGGVDITLTETE